MPDGGVRKRETTKAAGKSSSRKSKKSTGSKKVEKSVVGKPFIIQKRLAGPVRKSIASKNKLKLPKTAKISSRKSKTAISASRAHSGMSLTDLQMMAKSRGIPFGGLHAAQLVRKINNYY